MFRPNSSKQANAKKEGAGLAQSEAAKLIEAHLSYSHAIAAEVIRKLPPELEKKDIQGWAELGLVEAASAFDPSRGVQFKTFAYYRIKGAVYDGLRKMGWYSKGYYHQLRFEMHANDYLQDVSGEPPSPSASTTAELHDLKEITANLASCYMLSLEVMAHEPEDRTRRSAEEEALRNQQSRNLHASLAQLPETNRKVLEFCYFEGLTLAEAGERMGLSKSWVCRLHAKSLEMLRQSFLRMTAPGRGSNVATFPSPIR